MARIYKGFSTVGAGAESAYKLYDVALVRQDLLNHFHTRIGERVLRPDFGCRIWEMLMEPMTEVIKTQILAEAERICRSDPRVTVLQIAPMFDNHTVNIEFILNYHSFQNPDQFSISFDARQNM